MMKREPRFEGKLALTVFGHKVGDGDATSQEMNKFLDGEWAWKFVVDEKYGDGDVGFGVPEGMENDERVTKTLETVAKLINDHGMDSHFEVLEGTAGKITKVYETEEAVYLYFNY